MDQNYELPSDVDVEKELLAALLVRNGEVVPAVAAIVSVADFYRPEHQIIFRVILNLYGQDIPPNVLSIFEEMRQTGALEKKDCLLSCPFMNWTWQAGYQTKSPVSKGIG